MDARRRIFKLWTDDRYESIRETLSDDFRTPDDIAHLNSEIPNLTYECERCGKSRYLGRIDIMWMISIFPEKYLLEEESVVCSYCMLKRGKSLQACNSKDGCDMVFEYSKGKSGRRYIYNSRYNYYVRIPYMDLYFMEHAYEADWRLTNPKFNAIVRYNYRHKIATLFDLLIDSEKMIR